jgi:hypothetical protein
MKKIFLSLLSIVSLAASAFVLNACSDISPQDAETLANGEPNPLPVTPGGRQGVHGMVVFGTQNKTFFSHIPMFHAPHDVQLIMEVKLSANPKNSYNSGMHSFKPNSFSLDNVIIKVMKGETANITGALYTGNFEDGGAMLQDGITATVTRIVRKSQLVENASSVPYFLMFGTSPTYLVHVLNSGSDYDQISMLAPTQSLPYSANELQRGVVAQGTSRPRAGSTTALKVLGNGKNFGVTVQRELSCLKGPHYTERCN